MSKLRMDSTHVRCGLREMLVVLDACFFVSLYCRSALHAMNRTNQTPILVQFRTSPGREGATFPITFSMEVIRPCFDPRRSLLVLSRGRRRHLFVSRMTSQRPAVLLGSRLEGLVHRKEPLGSSHEGRHRFHFTHTLFTSCNLWVRLGSRSFAFPKGTVQQLLLDGLRCRVVSRVGWVVYRLCQDLRDTRGMGVEVRSPFHPPCSSPGHHPTPTPTPPTSKPSQGEGGRVQVRRPPSPLPIEISPPLHRDLEGRIDAFPPCHPFDRSRPGREGGKGRLPSC